MRKLPSRSPSGVRSSPVVAALKSGSYLSSVVTGAAIVAP